METRIITRGRSLAAFKNELKALLADHGGQAQWKDGQLQGAVLSHQGTKLEINYRDSPWVEWTIEKDGEVTTPLWQSLPK